MHPVGELVHLDAVVARVRHVYKAAVHRERLWSTQLSGVTAELAEREAEARDVLLDRVEEARAT